MRERIVFAHARRLPDGQVVPVAGYPEPCPACGDVPESIIAFVASDEIPAEP